MMMYSVGGLEEGAFCANNCDLLLFGEPSSVQLPFAGAYALLSKVMAAMTIQTSHKIPASIKRGSPLPPAPRTSPTYLYL